MTPEEILDDFARELKHLPRVHAFEKYIELRDKAKAQLAHKSRPDRQKLKEALKRDFKKLYVRQYTATWKLERMVRDIEIGIMSLDNTLALFSDEEEIRKEAWEVGYQKGERIANELEADMPSITRYGALQYIRDLYQSLREKT